MKGLRQRVAKVREFVAVTEINLDPVNSTRPEILHRYLQQSGWYSDFTAETPSTRASTVETSTLNMTPRIRNASVDADRFLGSDILPELMGEPTMRHALK